MFRKLETLFAIILLVMAGWTTTSLAQSDVLKTVRHGVGPVTGVWQEVGSTLNPCPGCLTFIAAQGERGIVHQDRCSYGIVNFDNKLSKIKKGQQESAYVLSAGLPSPISTLGQFSTQFIGQQLVLTFTPEKDDGQQRLASFSQTLERVRAADQFTEADAQRLSSMFAYIETCVKNNPDKLVWVRGVNDGQTQSQNSNNTANISDSSPNINVAEGVALGLLTLGAAVAIDQVEDSFFTEAPAPSTPPNVSGRSMRVQVNSVKAVETTFGFGGDEIFLLASNGQRFPSGDGNAHSINEGQVWNPNADLNAAGGVSIDLREWDSFNASDQIGNFSIDDNHQAGNFTTTLRGDGAVYEISYSVNVSHQSIQNVPVAQKQPPQSSRTWGAFGNEASISVADCSNDCEEDSGVILACQGEGLAARLSVPWAAIENGFVGSVLPLQIDVDGQRFDYRSTLSENGMVGFVPETVVGPNDPLIAALQAGTRARFIFEGVSTEIGLKGSRTAIDIFKAHCGWNNIQTAQQQNNYNQEHAVPLNDGLKWFHSSFEDFATGRLVSNLSFGIPETDAIGFNASCEPDGSILTSFLVDYGALQHGAPVQTFIAVSQQAYGFEGKVFEETSEWAGVRFAMSPKDPIWTAMQSAQQIAFGIVGGDLRNASSVGASQAINQFLQSCSSLSQPVQTQPMQQQQPVQQNSGGSGFVLPQPTQQQPVQQNSNGGGFQLPQPSQQKAVDQAAGTKSYLCDDGSNMTIEIADSGNVSIASIALGSGNQLALIRVPTSVGVKFSNGEATLFTSGNTAQLTTSSKSVFCEIR